MANKPPVATERTETEDGIIRRGNRNPYRKASRQVQQDRTEWVALSIAIQPTVTDGELKALMREKFGIQWKQALCYIARARKMVAERAKITKEHAHQIGINSLLDNIQNGTPSERNAAIRVWTEIFGNEAPKQHRISDSEGKPIPTAVIAPTVVFEVGKKE